MWKQKQRRTGRLWVLAALLWAQATGGMLRPAPVNAAPSADAAKEIVYLDANGFIQVLDYTFTATEVKWHSPGGGWTDIALGDFNNDGDMEIVAVGGGMDNGVIAVFDPVLSSGNVIPGQEINGIPWDTLYMATTPGRPIFVATGQFDPNVPGPEIIYLYELPEADRVNPGERTRMVCLKGTSLTPDGRSWQEHFATRFNETWEKVAVGDLDGVATTDEIALASNGDDKLDVLRVDSGVRSIFEYESQDRKPIDVAIGKWEGTTRNFLAWSRGAEPPLPAFLVQKWNSDGDFSDVNTEAFNPAPSVLFFAQINQNADVEVVLLRSVPDNQNSPRMIVRGRTQGSIPSELEQRLDTDNGYQAGAAGDVDGDGLDEIVIMRDNRIVVYYEPDHSAKNNVYELPTNHRTIVIGDLDKNGFIVGPKFGATTNTVTATVAAAGPTVTQVITLTNVSNAEPIPFLIGEDSIPTWLTVAPTLGYTPVRLTFTFNSQGLQAGDYHGSLLFTSSDARVVNQPFYINVDMRVTAAIISLNPTSLSFSVPCTTTAPAEKLSINITGTQDVRYTAAIAALPDVVAAQSALAGPVYNGYVSDEGDVVLRDGQGNEATVAVPGDLVTASGIDSSWPSAYDWMSARSDSDKIPDRITVSVEPFPSQPYRFADAMLVILADSRAGAPPGNVRLVPIKALCATNYQYLAAIQNYTPPVADADQ